MRKPKKRQCSVCGEVKPLSEFYTYKYKGRKYTRGFCNACDLRKRRERYREKHPGGLTYDRDTGKLWLRKGRGRSLVWTSQMLSDMRRLFPTTRNDELAGVLGLAVRTVVRKAREMGLEKDKEWLRTIWKTNIRMGQIDVYRNRTTLEITYRDSIPIDSIVVFKEIDVYRNRTTLEITYRDSIPIDSIVVFKE